jgi:hypothetical protein
LSIFGTTYTPSVSSGTPFWTLGFFLDATIAPGSTVTVQRRPDIMTPPSCYVFDGPCEDYYYSGGSNGPGAQCGSVDPCIIGARSVQVIHFPITTTVSKNFCDTTDRSNQSLACPGGVRVGNMGSNDIPTCSYPPLTTSAEADDSGETSRACH